MKTFFAVFLAILAAVFVIATFIEFDDLYRSRNVSSQLRAEADSYKRTAEFFDQMREQQYQETVRRIQSMPDRTPSRDQR